MCRLWCVACPGSVTPSARWGSGGDRPRRALPLDRRETSLLQAFRNRSMSLSVVVGPRLTRIAPAASAGATPMAASTCEAVTLPDEQAEPDETATPARSSAIRAVSALMPGTANSVVLGSRAARRAENRRPRARCCRSPASSRSRSARHVAGTPRPRPAARPRAAAPKPAMPATFSVPAAAAALLAAALEQRIGDMQRSRRLDQRADALRAADLVRRQRQKIGAERVDIERNSPGAWTASTCRSPPAACTSVGRRRRPAGSRRSRCWRA